jgi:prepilin-type processing-associated H-X9-DG protein/prepilin-type N-terminal cleavage/methylation domain-containing protein
MKTRATVCAFTLIELVVVIAIIACLVALVLPTLTNMRRRADSVACTANLRQIGISAQLYAGEHEQTLPTIEPWPSEPVYASSDGATNLIDALKAYGVTTATLQCRSDITGPNYFGKEHSSYQWCPMANGQNVRSVKLVWGGAMPNVSLATLLMAFDYSNVHNDKSNVLFGDGHVAAAD